MTTRRGDDDDAIVLKNTLCHTSVRQILMMWVILVSVFSSLLVARQIMATDDCTLQLKKVIIITSSLILIPTLIYREFYLAPNKN